MFSRDFFKFGVVGVERIDLERMRPLRSMEMYIVSIPLVPPLRTGGQTLGGACRIGSEFNRTLRNTDRHKPLLWRSRFRDGK